MKDFYMQIVYDFYKEIQIQILTSFLALYKKNKLHLREPYSNINLCLGFVLEEDTTFEGIHTQIITFV
jgi:hypothetical protein